VSAQNINSQKSDTSKKGSNWSQVLKSTGKDPLVIIDDIEGHMKITDLNPNDIQSITILKDTIGKNIYGEPSKNGVVLVTTMQFAKSKYQTILTYFSYEYAQAIHANKDDNDFTYVIDGIAHKGSNRDCVNKLSGLKSHNISSVKFENKGDRDHPSIVVSITTKQ
jgi:hypothetical protein